MFETTAWTTIRNAGRGDAASLETFAATYRPAVIRFIRSRGFDPAETEDLGQEVFLRILTGDVLARVDARNGRFRSLMLAVTVHVIRDRWRKRRDEPLGDIELVEDRQPDFDRAWVVHLTERAMAELAASGSPYHQVLVDHLAGRPTDRNKVWIARQKLISLIRREIALTCSSSHEFEEEVAYLARYLRPGVAGAGGPNGRPDEGDAAGGAPPARPPEPEAPSGGP